MKPLCIYHSGCADGLGAAWAVHKALGEEVEFVAAKYGERVVGFRGSLPIAEGLSECIIGRDILIVDFSYPLDILRAMAHEARSVLVLDHHKTAQEDLAELPAPPAVFRSWQKIVRYNPASGEPMVDGNWLAAIFDMNRSGAGITWDYLSRGGQSDTQRLSSKSHSVENNGRRMSLTGDHFTRSRPRIIDLIEDRDLWRFRFGDETRAFHAVLASYDWGDLPEIFRRLDDWSSKANLQRRLDQEGHMVEGGLGWPRVLNEGRAILRAQSRLVASAVAASRRTMRIAGHVVPVANVPPSMASDAGHLLCHDDEIRKWFQGWNGKGYNRTDAPGERIDFSATYYDGADGKRHFSLRSPEGGADVGEIAKGMAAFFNGLAAYDHNEAERAGYPWTGGGHPHASGFDAPLGWEGE